MNKRLDKQNICILGGASAIAQAYARRRAATGASFFLVDARRERLEAVASDLQARGAKQVEIMAVDLADVESHADIMPRAKSSLGGLDILLLAYGTLPDQAACEASAEETERQLIVNFVSAALLLNRFAEYFKQKGSGVIAVISSVAGDRGRQSNYVYGAAKGGLSAYASGLRNRLVSAGVHVLTIKPGFVDTPMTKNFDKGWLWVPPETVARDIDGAIQEHKDVLYTPWFWRWIMLVIRLIPERVFKRMKL